MSANTVTKSRPWWMDRIVLPILLVLAVGSIVSAFVIPLPSRRHVDVKVSDPPPVPSFSQTDRNGSAVTNKDLEGKVWICAFVFTRCSGPCPSVTATMAKLQNELKLAEQENLRLVTFTIDPERDTPDELKKYAERFQAHPTRWLFLTGPEDEQHRLATKGFMILSKRSDEEKPKAGMEFDHSTKLALVDKKGRIRGYFDGYAGKHDDDGKRFGEDFDRLKSLTASLLKE